MPTYEYACRSCGEHLEVVQSFKDDPLTTCPNCEGALKKVFSAAGIIFKGSGWHIKDYGSKSGGSAGGSSSETAADGDSSSGSSESGSSTEAGSSKDTGSSTSKDTGSSKESGSSSSAAESA